MRFIKKVFSLCLCFCLLCSSPMVALADSGGGGGAYFGDDIEGGFKDEYPEGNTYNGVEYAYLTSFVRSWYSSDYVWNGTRYDTVRVDNDDGYVFGVYDSKAIVVAMANYTYLSSSLQTSPVYYFALCEGDCKGTYVDIYEDGVLIKSKYWINAINVQTLSDNPDTLVGGGYFPDKTDLGLYYLTHVGSMEIAKWGYFDYKFISGYFWLDSTSTDDYVSYGDVLRCINDIIETCSGGGYSRDDVGNWYDEDGNLFEDDKDYGIFQPIVDFFKNMINRLQAIYVYVKTINNAITNSLRRVLSDPLDAIQKGIESIKEFFDSFDVNMETLFINLVSDIGESIIESIKSVFIPSEGYFEEKVEFLRNKIAVTFGVSAYDMSHIFSVEKSFTNFKVNMYGQELTIIDMSYVVDALGTVRPIIRGFITLCLVFYNINQFLLFIGQPAISLGNMIKSFASAD